MTFNSNSTSVEVLPIVLVMLTVGILVIYRHYSAIIIITGKLSNLSAADMIGLVDWTRISTSNEHNSNMNQEIIVQNPIAGVSDNS